MNDENPFDAYRARVERPLYRLFREYGRPRLGYFAVGMGGNFVARLASLVPPLVLGAAVDGVFNDGTYTLPLVPAGDSDAEGTGRIGMLAGPLTLGEFAEVVAQALPSTEQGVRVAGDLDGLVTTVAVVGGAGDAFLDTVRESGADAYVTADLRHHPASEAREHAQLGDGRPYLVDVAHYASEWAWLKDAAEHVADAAAVDTVVSTLSTDPWTARFGA